MATKPLTQTTGRRKEAVARARLRPGTGIHTINGKAFDAYFTTAMQRMTVTEALRVTETETTYDIDATMHGGGISGQAGALRMAIARSLVELDPEARAGAEEGRPAHPRPASQGEQEVRPQEGPQGPAVHQALIAARPWASFASAPMVCAGGCTDRARHRLRRSTWRAPRLDVLGPGPWLIGRDTRESGSALERAHFATACGACGRHVRSWPMSCRRRRWPIVAGMLDQPAAMITASHNPWFDNGVKIFAAGGLKLSDDVERRSRRRSARSRRRADGRLADSERAPAGARHVRARPLRPCSRTMRCAGLRIVLDCANGAMFEAAPQVAAPARRRRRR